MAPVYTVEIIGFVSVPADSAEEAIRIVEAGLDPDLDVHDLTIDAIFVRMEEDGELEYAL